MRQALALQLPSWEETVAITQWRRGNQGWICEPGPLAESEELNAALYSAMMLA